METNLDVTLKIAFTLKSNLFQEFKTLQKLLSSMKLAALFLGKILKYVLSALI